MVIVSCSGKLKNLHIFHSVFFTLSIVVLLHLIIPGSLRSDISKTNLWHGYEEQGIPNCYIFNQKMEALLTKKYYSGQFCNYLDFPIKVDAIRFTKWAGWEHYFILDKSRCLVQYIGTYDKELKYLKTHGLGYGYGVNQYKYPEGIAVQHNSSSHWHSLYILDTGNKRIQRLQFNRWTWEIQHPNNGPPDYIYSNDNNYGYGPLNKAHDISYCQLTGGQQSFLVVADTYNHRILFLKSEGEVIESIGGPDAGSGFEEFNFPYAVTTVDKADTTAYIYVADRGNNRIVQLELEYRNGYWNINWLKTMEFASDYLKRTIFPAVGIEDV